VSQYWKERECHSQSPRRCLTGRTQDADESLHALIWKQCTNEIFDQDNALKLLRVSR
jgi:hypothetical protein